MSNLWNVQVRREGQVVVRIGHRELDELRDTIVRLAKFHHLLLRLDATTVTISKSGYRKNMSINQLSPLDMNSLLPCLVDIITTRTVDCVTLKATFGVEADIVGVVTLYGH